MTDSMEKRPRKAWIPEPGKRLFAVGTAVLLILLCFVTFFNLGEEPIHLFDEARHGISAYEMLQTGEYVVTTYRYEPDYWNLKPPLSEYFIALGYRIFGYNSFGFRFFSGAFWIATAIGYAAFACRRFGKKAAWLVLFLFSALPRLFADHGPRTGDADAYFLFFTSYAVLALLCYDREKNRGRYLYAACLCFSFAFLSKSWHAGAAAVLIILYVFLYNRELFRNPRRILLCLLSALGPIAVWAVFRSLKDGTAFFREMIAVDLLKRSGEAIEDHGGGILFYIVRIGGDPAALGMCLLIILNAAKKKKAILKDPVTVTGILAVMIPVILFTFVKTKLHWYIWEIYPVLILLSGKALQEVTDRRELIPLKVPVLICSCGLLVFSCFTLIRNEIRAAPTALEKDMTGRIEISGDIYGKELYCDGDNRWLDMNNLLLMEWTGDFKCRNGGPEGWEKNAEALLLVKNDRIPEVPEGKTEAQGEYYSLLSH